MPKNHYQTLGVLTTATETQIRVAYRKLAAQLHPDRNPSPEATEMFIEVNRAYEVLMDRAKRRAYDAELRAANAPKPRSQASRVQREADIPRPPKSGPAPDPRVRFANQSVKTATPEMLRLTSLLAKGRFLDAERLARKMLEQDPAHPIPYAVLGDVFRFKGELKKAAEMYSFAAQMSPGNAMYQQKHEQVLEAMTRAAVQVTPGAPSDAALANAAVAPVVVTILAACYVALGREPALFRGVPLIDTWTLGLVGMLLISGIVTGASLSLSRNLEPFVIQHGSALSRISPGFMIGAIAALNFWVAALLYFVIAVTQDSFNRTTSRTIGTTAGITLVLSLASAYSPGLAAEQTLLWGGNVIYTGLLCGWMFSDSLRA
ncbi:MAG: DnaJ domain-containing protein [Chthonomonas sp.]|nr:DnaJ domain-containing protein [Chthonomonas sp.]